MTVALVFGVMLFMLVGVLLYVGVMRGKSPATAVEAPSAVLTGFQAPSGLLESTGRVALDAGHVIRNPGIQYWPSLVGHVTRLIKMAGPLTWLLCFAQGAFITIQASTIMGSFGIDRGLSALIVSSLGVRELTMIMAMAAIGASAGAGFVTELGSMRVSEEIDAIEVMGLDSFPFLVSTRVIASMIAAVPILIFALVSLFLGGYLSAAYQFDNIAIGSYLSFFWTGVTPLDLVFAISKGVVGVGIIALVCTTTGYRASGGPVGVGMAVGEALNLTLVLVMIVNLLLSYLFWGITDTVKI